MFVLGGFGNARGKNYEYDPAADKWTKKAAMPRPAHHQAMIEYQGKIYVFGGFVAPMSGPQGGWEPIDNAWVYDPAADSWRNLAPMPIKRGSAAANIVNGKVYVMGGLVGGAPSNQIWRLDPPSTPGGAVALAPVATLPVPLADAAVAVDGDVAYVAGGESPALSSAVVRVEVR